MTDLTLSEVKSAGSSRWFIAILALPINWSSNSQKNQDKGKFKVEDGLICLKSLWDKNWFKVLDQVKAIIL